MVVKKLFPLQNVMKKLFEMHYSSKKFSASPKNGNPLPGKKNNGPSLTKNNHLRMSLSLKMEDNLKIVSENIQSSEFPLLPTITLRGPQLCNICTSRYDYD